MTPSYASHASEQPGLTFSFTRSGTLLSTLPNVSCQHIEYSSVEKAYHLSRLQKLIAEEEV